MIDEREEEKEEAKVKEEEGAGVLKNRMAGIRSLGRIFPNFDHKKDASRDDGDCFRFLLGMRLS